MAAAVVKDLLAQHAVTIDELKQETNDYAGKDIGVPFDELFILRFVLSAKGDLKVAGKKLRETLEWRVSNLDQLNEAANGNIPHYAEVTRFTRDGLVGWLGEHDLLFVVRFGLGDLNALLNAVPEDQFLAFLLFNNEVNFRKVDQRTRETGVLCKVVSLIDLHGFAMSRFNRRFPPLLGKNSHLNNIYYPQLLRCMVMLHLPTVVKMVMNATKMLMSKETLDKQRVCPGRPHGGKQTAADCPFLKSKLGGDGAAAVKMLPPFLGGTAPVPDHLQHPSDA